MNEEKVTEDIARIYLRDVKPMWKAFWFHMHLVAKNLDEFAAGMARISDEVFVYHASGQKNDFAAWVQEVIGDSILARRLEAVATREEALAVLRRRIDELKLSLGK